MVIQLKLAIMHSALVLQLQLSCILLWSFNFSNHVLCPGPSTSAVIRSIMGIVGMWTMANLAGESSISWQ